MFGDTPLSRFGFSFAVYLLVGAALAQSCKAADFELRQGDRVVLLGDGLIEQEQYFGWVELMLTTAYPDRDVTFRNLGWNADTPSGESRFGLSLLQAGREPEDEGWKQLQKQLELTQPTVLILGYGMASSLERRRRGLNSFIGEYERLLQRAFEMRPDMRIVVLSPLKHLASDRHNETLAQYSQAIRYLAENSGATFVDISATAMDASHRKDPIHLNSLGYRELAENLAKGLGCPPSQWQENENAEQLRQVILRKNEWWFHRSRPANMAYVFGFRKHEQGQNAVEIPQYDKLVAAEESVIKKLRNLADVEIEKPEPRFESKFAEFTEQPKPEFTVAEGWEVNLWAQNPLLNKPIHMNFDPQGRLWIASSEAYPMIEVGQSSPDKIVVLEDTNGDGTADQSSVFADGLLIPTGIAPGNGGVYVAQSTDLLFLKDEDGDGKADSKQRLLSGFGTEDTHHNLHTLRWGPDGQLYMNQSVYTRTEAETPHGVVRLRAGGGLKLDTETLKMEIFFRGLWNSWGHQFDAYGQSFLTDGAGFAGIAYTFPGASFNPTPRARQQLDLISPGNYPKFASLEIVQGPSFPADWQGSLVTCDFRANRVTRFSLADQGSGFVTKQEADLLRTSAPTFRPIDVKQGPDGALYIADWSNPIINHGEVDFRDSRRDRWHGRIWRLRWKGAPESKPQDFNQLSNEQLLEHLTGTDQFHRDQSRRVLIERGEAVSSALADWSAQVTADRDRLEALWLHQALKLPCEQLVEQLLACSDGRVRAAVTRALPYVAIPDAERLAGLTKSASDAHPRVRLEAARGLAKLATDYYEYTTRVDDAIGALLSILLQDRDRFIDHALFLAVNDVANASRRNQPLLIKLAQDPRQQEFVLTSVQPDVASRFLTEALTSSGIPDQGPMLSLIGKVGNAEQLETLFLHALSFQTSAAGKQQALRALAEAQRLQRRRPASGLQRVAPLLRHDSQEVRLAAIQLVGQWRLAGQYPALLEIAQDDSASTQMRVQALSAIRDLGNAEAAQPLLIIATETSAPSPIRETALAALGRLAPDMVVDPAIKLLAASSSEGDALRLWRRLLETQGVGKRLASKIANAEFSQPVLLAGLKATKDPGRKEKELQGTLQQFIEQIAASPMTPKAVAELATKVGSGDPHRGELVYRRADLACTTCHAIGGIGGRVGPDMTSLGASAPVDYLAESLFFPNAKIKEGFHSTVVLTVDDQILTGVEISATDDELVLRDAKNEEIRIATADVVGKRAGDSLMPTGVVDRLSKEEQIDLLSFLSQLGKPGDFDATNASLARQFEILAGTHRLEQQGTDRIIDGSLKQGWKSTVTLVKGSLPKAMVQELTRQPINISLVNVYARTKMEIPQEQPVTIQVEGRASLWVDGKPIDGDMQSGQSRFQTELGAGTHTVLVRLDARDLPENLHVRCDEGTFVGL